MIKLPEIEFSDKASLLDFQFNRLKENLDYVSQNSPYYKRVWEEEKIDTIQILTFDDFEQIPFTSKQDLQTSNMDFLCVEKSEVSDWVTTSGTMGTPVSFGLTAQDISRLGYNEALSYVRCGIGKGDVIQITTTIDKRFMAGLAYFEGARKLGIPCVRMGPGAMGLQWDSIQRFNVTAIVGVPSFILRMIDFANKNGIDIGSTSVKKILCIGEPVRSKSFALSPIAKEITNNWDVQLFGTYASTEMNTAFTECCYGKGGHLQPELGFVEVIDAEGNHVKEGEVGEVVFTSFQIEAMPIVRFKTGDLAQLYINQCECGSISPRIGSILGRKNQLIKFKGTTVYPNELIHVLQERRTWTLYY